MERIQGDYPNAAARAIARFLQKNKTDLNISGVQSSTAVSFVLSHDSICKNKDLTNVVIVDSLHKAHDLKAALSYFRPDYSVHLFPAFDQSPYSGLYPSPLISWERTDFLYWAGQAGSKARFDEKSHIFIIPVAGLLQKTVPFSDFQKSCRTLKAGDELETSFPEFLNQLGYQASPMVEDKGQYAVRGGLVDIYSPAASKPVRIELFGDQVESLRLFDSTSQISSESIQSYPLVPVFEYALTDDNIVSVIEQFKNNLGSKVAPAEKEDALRSLTLKNYFPGIEYTLPYSFKKLESALDHFSSRLQFFILDTAEITRASDEFLQNLNSEKRSNDSNLFGYAPEKLFFENADSLYPKESKKISFSNLEYLEEETSDEERTTYSTHSLFDFIASLQFKTAGSDEWNESVKKKFDLWKNDHYKIFISSAHKLNFDRALNLVKNLDYFYDVLEGQDYKWKDWLEKSKSFIYLLPRDLEDSILINDDRVIFLKDVDFLGKKQKSKSAAQTSSYEEFNKNAKRLNFGDLKVNDLVVHVKHGVGVYEGLKIMNIGGVESEYIQIAYKDKDKLYLPVYRVGQLQKFSSSASTSVLDKLGGTGWEKTKIKVKSHLKDIAAELLQLYSKRSEIKRDPLEVETTDYQKFEYDFPYDETNDQIRAITDINKDFASEKPMDRLVCGDVGFGKTEVAMRATFQAVMNGKQVAVLAPTTVLTFQHFETFKKRFAGFPIEIRSLNRFVSTADAKKTLKELKDGKVHILIGTHRLFSKDVVFKDLGLMVIDEEQKFGVVHKEKIKKLKVNVDTLTLSATPIPRTLNMSFSGIRDLSIINTPPVDRLPTRTFVSKFDTELIRKAIVSEMARGGQIYFIHNRVQSIYSVAEEIRKVVPDARIRVAHGQMDEEELESAMLAFFNHEIDILICTAIVESGMDVPRANTMFIDQAQMFGLAQLYQLRGRVGRSKTRAYCYLLMPKDRKLEKDALERLKIIQENSALGSGIKIAQYDLELRGAGNILGDDQSGHVNSVGYELYMDLLNEAIAEVKGIEKPDYELDPEINLKIPALIPDAYIADIRLRLGYYKALADIDSQEDLDRIENELTDQFGPLPEPVINLMGLMLIRKQCKDLGVRDISAGLKTISLVFTERTKLKPEKAIELSMRANKKYALTPDQRLNIRLNNITWTSVYEELQYLISLI